MDAVQQVADLTRTIGRHQAAIHELAPVRVEAMRAALGSGVSRRDLAEAMGVSLAAVTKLVGADPRLKGVGGRRVRVAGESGVYPGNASGGGDVAHPGQPERVAAPEPHRHRYASTGWNHARGGYLLRQVCECGDERVVPSPRIPGELRTASADTSIRV